MGLAFDVFCNKIFFLKGHFRIHLRRVIKFPRVETKVELECIPANLFHFVKIKLFVVIFSFKMLFGV